MAAFPIKIYRVAERSMEPTLREGGYVLALGFGGYRPKDIIVLKHPTKPITIIKRVGRVESGRIFVVGDNVDESEDSRKFGMVDAERVVGKVVFRIQ